MTADTRAVDRAQQIADRLMEAYDPSAAEAAEVLPEDDLWGWLVVATDRAEDMETYRTLELNHGEQRHDELHGHLERAHGHLLGARDLRRDELLEGLLDEYDPDVVFDG